MLSTNFEINLRKQFQRLHEDQETIKTNFIDLLETYRELMKLEL